MLEMKKKIDAENVALLTVCLGMTKQLANVIGQLLLPLLAILGGFFLWKASLESPTIYQLIGLTTYGLLVVIPVLWKSK